MEDAGLDFRATKDLDIVLYIEVLNAQVVLPTNNSYHEIAYCLI